MFYGDVVVSNAAPAHVQSYESFQAINFSMIKVFSDSRRIFFLSEDLPPG